MAPLPPPPGSAADIVISNNNVIRNRPSNRLFEFLVIFLNTSRGRFSFISRNLCPTSKNSRTYFLNLHIYEEETFSIKSH